MFRLIDDQVIILLILVLISIIIFLIYARPSIGFSKGTEDNPSLFSLLWYSFLVSLDFKGLSDFYFS